MNVEDRLLAIEAKLEEILSRYGEIKSPDNDWKALVRDSMISDLGHCYYNWAAMDKDGCWYAYSEKPIIDATISMWCSIANYESFYMDEDPDIFWRDSLVELRGG